MLRPGIITCQILIVMWYYWILTNLRDFGAAVFGVCVLSVLVWGRHTHLL